MRKWLYVAWAAVIVMTIVSATFNFIFGWRLGENSYTVSALVHDGYVYGILSVAADGFKIAFGVLTVAFFMAKGISPTLRTLGVSLCGLIWVLATVYALNSAFGSVATNRTDMAGIREARSTNYEAVNKQLQHVQQQRDWLERHRASATIEGELARERQSHLWSRSAGCTLATAAESRTFCQRYYALVAELGTAKRDEELAQQGEKLRASLAAAGGKMVADPHAHFLHELTGYGENAIVLAWMMLLVALVEGGSTLGPVGLYLVRQNMTPRKAAVETPGAALPAAGITLAVSPVSPTQPRALLPETPIRTDLTRKASAIDPESPPPGDSAPVPRAPITPIIEPKIPGPTLVVEDGKRLTKIERKRRAAEKAERAASERIAAVEAFTDECLEIVELTRGVKGSVISGGTEGLALRKKFREWAKTRKKWSHLHTVNDSHLGRAFNAVLDAGKDFKGSKYGAVMKSQRRAAA